jgi:hypothetical protein
MTGKALDISKIETLLKYDENKSRINAGHTPKWPSENGYKLLAKAVLQGSKSIELEGKTFTLRYIHDGYVNVNPVGKNYVPCGCFSIEELTHGVH